MSLHFLHVPSCLIYMHHERITSSLVSVETDVFICLDYQLYRSTCLYQQQQSRCCCYNSICHDGRHVSTSNELFQLIETHVDKLCHAHMTLTLNFMTDHGLWHSSSYKDESIIIHLPISK